MRLLMEECILMDVEQVTGNRCAHISRARHENRWWEFKMSKLYDQLILGSNQNVRLACLLHYLSAVFVYLFKYLQYVVLFRHTVYLSTIFPLTHL